MQKHRPTPVLVMAILNLIFGGGVLVCYLCGGVGILGLTMLLNQPGAAKDPGLQQMKDQLNIITQVPGATVFIIGNLILQFILSLVLVIAGIGLLKMQNWARIACIVVAVVTIVENLAGLVYQVVYYNPAVAALQRDLQAKNPAPFGNNPFEGNATVNNISQGFGTFIYIAYAIALLIIMLKPSVVAAFHASATGMPFRPPEEEDLYDRGGWGSSSEPPPSERPPGGP